MKRTIFEVPVEFQKQVLAVLENYSLHFHCVYNAGTGKVDVVVTHSSGQSYVMQILEQELCRLEELEALPAQEQ